MSVFLRTSNTFDREYTICHPGTPRYQAGAAGDMPSGHMGMTRGTEPG